jgi:hypothetical protein
MAVVCSAACGSDLLLLEVASQMRLDQFVLLPAEPEAFRKSSVIDRPGNWGEVYDRTLKTAHVKVLHLQEGQEGYREVNLKLLEEGQQLARKHGVPAEALVIWNGTSRGPDDVTAHFLQQAKLRKITVLEIPTI